jgi:uncharacterized protein YbjT (DUF2867 family)
VLLSGRGEDEALRGELAVRDSGADWTILRSTWFSQNFSEGFFVDQVLNGEVHSRWRRQCSSHRWRSARVGAAATGLFRIRPGCGGHWDLGRRASTPRARLIRRSWQRPEKDGDDKEAQWKLPCG